MTQEILKLIRDRLSQLDIRFATDIIHELNKEIANDLPIQPPEQ